MSLSVGIVGLPNVGKSTLFNALLKKQSALAANYPFATIEPNVGIVPVPDQRLHQLATVVESNSGTLPPLIPATVEFVDIAGIVKGASEGEGLGNKFLSHIREVDCIAFVVRAFSDSDVVETGSQDVGEDLETVIAELVLKDLESVEKKIPELEKRMRAQDKDAKVLHQILVKLQEGFNNAKLASDVLNSDEQELVKELFLLTSKPKIYVVNINESELADSEKIANDMATKLSTDISNIVIVSAKAEAELSQLGEEDQKEYLEMLGLDKSGLERFITTAYDRLGLISYLTAGEKEVRAWTITKGMSAPQAAGVIHTDFEKKFIKAQVTVFEDYVEFKGWKGVGENGKLRMEGKDYVVKDGDVIEFKVGS